MSDCNPACSSDSFGDALTAAESAFGDASQWLSQNEGLVTSAVGVVAGKCAAKAVAQGISDVKQANQAISGGKGKAPPTSPHQVASRLPAALAAHFKQIVATGLVASSAQAAAAGNPVASAQLANVAQQAAAGNPAAQAVAGLAHQTLNASQALRGGAAPAAAAASSGALPVLGALGLGAIALLALL